ncbi:MAG: lysylphosphatidylglycerol synthase transmembrane domain-containing protein [Dehalococcoidia bacterium]
MLLDKKMLIMGLLCTAIFTYILFYLFIDIPEIINVLKNVNLIYIFLSLIFYFISLYFRTKRWRYLLRENLPTPKRTILPVIIFGYMANNIIPVRIGEFLRSYYLSVRENISSTFVFGTIIIERLMDVIALVFFFTVGSLLGSLFYSNDFEDFSNSLPGGKTIIILLSLLPFIIISLILLIYNKFPQKKFYTILEKILFFVSNQMRTLIMSKIILFFNGLITIRKKNTFFYTLIYSLIIWICEGVMYYVISLGFDLDIYFESTFELISVIIVFSSIVNLAGIIPSTAGSWGPFDFFGSLTLITLGVNNEVAVAYSLLVHIALWLPPTLIGFVIIILDHKTIIQVLKNFKQKKVSDVK